MAPELICQHCRARVPFEFAGAARECPSCHAALVAVHHAPLVDQAPFPGVTSPGEPEPVDGGIDDSTVSDLLVSASRPARIDDTDVLDQVPPTGPNPPAPASGGAVHGPIRSAGPSPLAWKLLISYASAVTLLCIYLVWLVFSRGSTLDLPDLKAPAAGSSRSKVTVLYYVRPDQPLPASHVLRLGQTARYGSLEITPLRVSRGPLEFRYFDPQAPESRAPSSEVLQLHLRLRNASADQRFVPLDRSLVFTREPDRKNPHLIKANNFVCEAGQLASPARHVFVYDLPPDTNWIIDGQNLDHELGPGESIDAFIPTTEEGLEELTGDLAWRVHFRKGYNPQSLRGVTSLIEVRFHSSEISNRPEPRPGRSA